MKINDYHIKIIILWILIPVLFSSAFATTTKKWREIVNQLEDDWRPNNEIKVAIEDLWYNSKDYLWENITPNLTVIKATDNDKTLELSQEGKMILRELIEKWWTENEIRLEIKNLWYDPDIYFTNSFWYSWDSKIIYTSRSCKKYNIEYIELLDAYTSPDLQKKEYFISLEYMKRYIDSKNNQQPNCQTNAWRVSTPYKDTSLSNERYIAPNWKIYFIIYKDWYYSSDLINSKKFSSLSEIKYYIRDRNPLIWMEK